MIWLLYSIACSTIIFLLFKWMDQKGVHTLTTIVINYAMAATFGWLQSGAGMPQAVLPPWWWSALTIGALFVGMFVLIAATAQRVGVSVATVANKMSLVIPVVAGVFLFGDALGALRIVGVLLALVAVFLVAHRPGSGPSGTRQWWLPVLLFVGSGFMDTLIKYTESYLLPAGESAGFLAVCFAVALLCALGYSALQGGIRLSGSNVGYGIALGLVNYGSIWFFVQALTYSGLATSVVFPVNNMAIVGASAVLAWLMFKERLSRVNVLGIGLAVVAIAIIAWW